MTNLYKTADFRKHSQRNIAKKESLWYIINTQSVEKYIFRLV